MKPLINNIEKSPIDASNNSVDGNDIAACDLIDTACKKLSLSSKNRQQQLPDQFNLILNNNTISRVGLLANQRLLLPTDYHQQQPNGHQQQQAIRKASFFSTASTNLAYGIGKHCRVYEHQADDCQEKPSSDEKSKLIYHDEGTGEFGRLI